jgi:hypothetical protein
MRARGIIPLLIKHAREIRQLSARRNRARATRYGMNLRPAASAASRCAR